MLGSGDEVAVGVGGFIIGGVEGMEALFECVLLGVFAKGLGGGGEEIEVGECAASALG